MAYGAGCCDALGLWAACPFQITKQQIMIKILPYLLGTLLLASAVGHVVYPEFYAAMVPGFFPTGLANILATIFETIIGLLLFTPKYQRWGGFGFLFLMITFLPIHILDLFKATPAIGPSPAPEIRLVLQFVLMYAGWWVYSTLKQQEHQQVQSQ